MTRILYLFSFLIIAISAHSETVTLYNDNGNGGIHRSTGRLVIDEGQYYVDLDMPSYNGKTKVEHLKVYRVKDSARLLYNQDKWAGKYRYVVERSRSFFSTTPYYFNMSSKWIPSHTEDPDDPDRVIPIKKLTAYRCNLHDEPEAFKVVLVKTQGKYLLYHGDEFFCARIESNARPLDFAPAWARQFKYRSKISGFNVYFNISNGK